MLRVVAHQSAAAARQYYAEGLKREDYYSEGQEVAGRWHGKAAKQLGISGQVEPEAFAALVENRHPVSGAKLTPRMKADRRVGYDINFHAPKSLSILQALTGDERIVSVFREAVRESMNELEERVGTRVRKGGAKGNRVTGNLAWAEFVHFTARPVGGIPDPHLHVHCFAFNVTFDHEEKRWKAAEFHDLKKEAPYCEAAFHARLAEKVAALGYGIDRTAKGWEVAGISRELVEKFSRRTAQIEEVAAKKGVKGAKEKDALAALTREGKRHGLNYSDLLAAWNERLSPAEKAMLSRIRYEEPEAAPKVSAREAVDYAIEKCFEKSSVVVQNRLVSEALKHGVGFLKPEQVWKELSKREMVVRKVADEILCTTLEVLAEEVALVDFVRSGRGTQARLGPRKLRFGDDKLSDEQRRAVRHILTSKDQVIALRGGAGVGKTTLMQEAARQIEAAGLRIFAFAPSASASRETLRESGFHNANTVAHLLHNKKLQEQTRGQVIWIDEAGLIGVRDLWQIMKIAGHSTRVILTGDSGQHAPVSRGDAFRLLQRFAGLRIAEVTQIRRQQQETYRQAVAAMSKGDLPNAFRLLDELGAIVEVGSEAERYKLLAADFLELSRKGAAAPLVVSPTRAESKRVTEAIRDARREAGQLKGERSFVRYQDLEWGNADKRRVENYREGLLVQFNQNAKGIRRGEIFEITGRAQDEVLATGGDGRKVTLPLKNVERFQVYEKQQIELGKGEQIRITRNGESANGHRLNNGNLCTVEGFKKNGNIQLSNGIELRRDHGHFTYGYCQTSHSSQSKSVKNVLVAQSEKSFVASSREQFYVSISRGKESIRIYTDSRDGLQRAVGNSSARRSGIEFAGISASQISAMNSEMSNKVWTKTLQSRKEDGQKMSHLRALLRSRKQDVNQKPKGFSWRQYVEMRRGLVGPDGKSRSKGSSQAPKKRNGNAMVQNRRSFLRPTEFTAPTKEKMLKAGGRGKAEVEKKPDGEKAKTKLPGQNKLERLANAYKAGAGHLKNVLNRNRGGGEQDKKSFERAGEKNAAEALKNQKAADVAKAAVKQNKPQAGSALRAAKHAIRQKSEQAAKAVQQQAVKIAQKVKAQVKPPAPPPPGPKK